MRRDCLRILSIKPLQQEASGWPSECIDEQSKNEYIRQYKLVENIDLDPNNIQHNSGLRLLGKLLANSFWGKFGQRDNLGKTVLVRTKEELYQIICDEANEVTKLYPVSEELLYVHYRQKDEHIVGSPNTNVVIAAFTTAQARLKLYSYLEQLGDRVL